MSVWKKARKKPVLVRFREVEPSNTLHISFASNTQELIRTREGNLWATKGRDFVIEGVEGELYPIDQKIFKKTYEVIEE